MNAEHRIRRYSAFFPGWAQAFGEHQALGEGSGGQRWLSGADQVGLILEPRLKRLLYPLFLHHRDLAEPTATLWPDGLEIEGTHIPLNTVGASPLPQVLELLAHPGPLHLYQTYHLIYPSGTRILTLSARAPLTILYRELSPLRLTLAMPTAGA